MIDALIEAEIAAVIDRAAWNSGMAREGANRDLIGEIAQRFSDVRKFLAAGGGGTP